MTPGWPRLYELSNSVPEDKCASIVADDGVSLAAGFGPVPSVKNLVLKTAGQNDDAFLAFYFAARNSTPSFLFISPATFIFSCCLLRTSVCSCVSAAPRFIFRQERLAGSESVFQAAQDNGRVDVDSLFV